MTKKQKIEAEDRAKKGIVTPRQERFCQNYVVDLNGAAAARRAGYSVKAAKEEGSRLLTKVNIQRRISEIRAEHREAGTEPLRERLMLELQRISLADTRKLYDAVGNLLPPDQWDDETAAAVTGIETIQLPGLGVGFAKKVRSADKTKAIEILNRMQGYNAPDKVAQTDVAGKDVAIPVININVIPAPVPFARSEKEIDG